MFDPYLNVNRCCECGKFFPWDKGVFIVTGPKSHWDDERVEAFCEKHKPGQMLGGDE